MCLRLDVEVDNVRTLFFVPPKWQVVSWLLWRDKRTEVNEEDNRKVRALNSTLLADVPLPKSRWRVRIILEETCPFLRSARIRQGLQPSIAIAMAP